MATSFVGDRILSPKFQNSINLNSTQKYSPAPEMSLFKSLFNQQSIKTFQSPRNSYAHNETPERKTPLKRLSDRYDNLQESYNTLFVEKEQIEYANIAIQQLNSVLDKNLLEFKNKKENEIVIKDEEIFYLNTQIDFIKATNELLNAKNKNLQEERALEKNAVAMTKDEETKKLNTKISSLEVDVTETQMLYKSVGMENIILKNEILLLRKELERKENELTECIVLSKKDGVVYLEELKENYKNYATLKKELVEKDRENQLLQTDNTNLFDKYESLKNEYESFRNQYDLLNSVPNRKIIEEFFANYNEKQKQLENQNAELLTENHELFEKKQEFENLYKDLVEKSNTMFEIVSTDPVIGSTFIELVEQYRDSNSL